VGVAVGPDVGDLLSLLFDPGAVFFAAVIVWQADLLEDERLLRALLVLSLLAVFLLEVVDALGPVVPAIPDVRAVWYAVAPVTAFLEVAAMWGWIARRELRIERAEDGQRALEDAVERERRANALLRRKEAWLFDFFEKAPDLLLVLAPGTSEIQRCNRRFSETLGYARRELIGRKLLDLVEPTMAGPVRSILETRRRRVRNLLLHLRRQDGSALIVLANLAVRSDPDGVEEVRAVLHDVTRLEHPGAADLSRAIAEHAAIGLFHSDDRGHCALVNASFCELTGLTPERAREQTWLHSVHPDDRHGVESLWGRSAAERLVFRAEHRLQNPAGPTRRVVTECVPLPDEQGGGFAGSMTSRPAERAGVRGAAPHGGGAVRGDLPRR
jgi:PAS domain S-box-containing protein